MPYLILIIGLLIGLYGFMRYFTKADIGDVKAIFAWIGWGLIVFMLLLLALTGRIVPAIVIMVLLLPFALAHLKARPKNDSNVIDVEPIEDEDEDDTNA